MRILFEDHHYSPELLKPLLEGSGINPKHVKNDTMLSLDYVGYYYNPREKDCVFILPKVLLDTSGKVLSFDPASFARKEDEATPERKKLLDFVYGFSVWVYRAISVYREKHPDSDIASTPNIAQMSHGKRRDRYTFLDILLELLQFNRDNQDYLTFIIRNLHSGYNKINWTRTISHSQAIIQNGSPIYIDPVNKKKQVNFDEELLVIYYSILNYIHEEYGFKVSLNANFDLIRGHQFEHYIKGFGKKRLKQIKYKYFSDKALRIWDLCYAFFDAAYKVAISTDTRDYLLIHSFHTVFEDMVDELISDHSEEVEKMKEQEDGKRLDHLYKYYGLTDHADKEDKVYYIGDSKYYRRDHAVTDDSIAKQYTYARNLIQYNLNLFLDRKPKSEYQKYRDEATEGYDIVPNFFISARVDEINKKGYTESKITPKLTKDGDRFYISRHFENRLFDRDTVLVAHYDVNFLFVLALYARDNSQEKLGWKNKVRDQFRKEIREGLIKEYDFYGMRPKYDNVDDTFIKEHFKEVLGKVFKPYGEKAIYSLALSSASEFAEDNKKVKDLLSESFYITEKLKSMDEDPVPQLDKLGETACTAFGVTSASQGKAFLGCPISGLSDAAMAKFAQGTATEYKIYEMPAGNILGVQFFVPFVKRVVNGYYKVEGVSFSNTPPAHVIVRLSQFFPLDSRKIDGTVTRHAGLYTMVDMQKYYTEGAPL